MSKELLKSARTSCWWVTTYLFGKSLASMPLWLLTSTRLPVVAERGEKRKDGA